MKKGAYMRPNRKIWMIMLAVFLWCTSTGKAQQVGKERLELLTPQEAELLRQAEGEWEPIVRMRSIPPGPFIQVKHPQAKDTEYGLTLEMYSPSDFVVIFERNRVPVDMDSLKIRAKKGIFSKSLTKRLKPYIKETTLNVEGMKIPHGKFTFIVSVADLEGAETVETYRMIINKR